MRTIKFRAKVFDEPNEWVIGYLVKKGNHYCIIQEYEHEGSKSCGWGVFGIDEETLGEFTGLYDKNGKEVYEGDIVYYRNSNHDEEDGAMQVIYEDAGFIITGTGILVDLHECYEYELEVIGNIWDNKELLEGE